ncbi:hypothetical protein ALC60_07644 [Trachymyrmex zeteki]|uniref:Uncharacterized protein n=1 Tax=Mycetomoellerius zeteki TaxID=64791 RepID=A0A151WZK7_9HYME|nr:hypothetical protein ALC60_07644 [Trachymyrmex zeteki]
MRLSTKTVEGPRRDGSDKETTRNYEKRSTGPHEERCPKRETIFAQAECRRLEIDGDRQRCMPSVFVRTMTASIAPRSDRETMRARDYRIDDLSESFCREDRSERPANAHLDQIEKFDLEITRIVKSDRNPPDGCG